MANDAFSVDWMQGWNELQRKIWNEWITMVGEKLPGVPSAENATQWPMQWLQQAMKTDPASWNSRGGMGGMGMGGMGGMGNASPWPAMPWSQPSAFGSGSTSGMDSWMRSFGIYSPEPTPEASIMGNMTAATEGFMRISKEIFQALQQMGEGVQNGEEWTALLERSIQQAKDLFSGQGAGQASMEPMAAWSQPLQMWTGMLKNNPMFSSSVMRSLLNDAPHFSGNQSAEAWMGQILGMPGLGLNREKQERMQAGIRDGLAYQKAFQAFQKLSSQVNLNALDLMHKKLLERGASNDGVKSLRDLYVLWVDCSEEANSTFVRGEEYQKASSRMTNALARVQRHIHTTIDETLESFHMPTRKEIDSSHRQVQDLKRRLRALEDEIKELRTKDHSAELNAIRDDLERLDVRNLRQELSNMKKLLESPLSAQAVPEKKAASKSQSASPRSNPQPSATGAHKESSAIGAAGNLSAKDAKKGV